MVSLQQNIFFKDRRLQLVFHNDFLLIDTLHGVDFTWLRFPLNQKDFSKGTAADYLMNFEIGQVHIRVQSFLEEYDFGPSPLFLRYHRLHQIIFLRLLISGQSMDARRQFLYLRDEFLRNLDIHRFLLRPPVNILFQVFLLCCILFQ